MAWEGKGIFNVKIQLNLHKETGKTEIIEYTWPICLEGKGNSMKVMIPFDGLKLSTYLDKKPTMSRK